MIPTAFEYVRASSVDEALASLAEHGDEAKVLAGGHSLLPMMKLRLAAPGVLIDIARIPELSYIRFEEADGVGACASRIQMSKLCVSATHKATQRTLIRPRTRT